MMRHFFLVALAFNLAFGAAATWAQQPNKVPIVGYLAIAAGPDDPAVEALRQGLHELGYVEGRNIRIEFRTAQGHIDRLPGLAEELVQLKADVFVVMAPLAAQTVQHATSTIPIVVATFDPVAAGLATSLAHPDGQVTGLSSTSTELFPKRLQLLKETIPRLTRVAVLWNPATPWHPKVIEDLKAAAPSMSVKLNFVRAQAPEEFDAAFSAMSQAHAQALY